MITKLILGIIQFPKWLQSMKTKNLYLYLGTWTIILEIIAIIFNFFTFRNEGLYFVLMLVIPLIWTFGQIVYLAIMQRKQLLTPLIEPIKTLSLPMDASIWTDVLGSMAILFIANGFDGSENDYLFVLVMALLVKGLMRFVLTKLPKKGVIYAALLFLMISLLLTLALYSFATTV